MPSLTAAEHREVQNDSNAARAAGARASRVRVSETVILEAAAPDGKRYTVALSQKENWRAYLLWADPKTNALTCGCFQFNWRKVCAHTEAFAVHGPPGGPGAPPPLQKRSR
jgi:hypothetical protein